MSPVAVVCNVHRLPFHIAALRPASDLRTARVWFHAATHFGLSLVLLCCWIPPLGAQERTSDQRPAAAVPADGEPEAERPAASRRQRQREVEIGFYLWCGVFAVLALVMLWTLWWGRRIRRILKEPLPAANPPDDFWFLKHRLKRPAAPPNPPPPATGPESES